MSSFTTLSLPLLLAVNAASILLLLIVLGSFSRAKKRRKMLVQSLAVTADDDDAAMHQWALLERHQRRMRIEYVAFTLLIAAASVVFMLFLPTWP